MINKELSNDQRARLEQIAKDEFSIRQRELDITKQKTLNDWMAQEKSRMKKNPLVKQYLKLVNQTTAVQRQLNQKGFSITTNGHGEADLFMLTSNYGNPHNNIKAYLAKTKACRIDRDVFTRGLNKVLSVIWSMEQPFSECIKLIEAEVKKIK